MAMLKPQPDTEPLSQSEDLLLQQLEIQRFQVGDFAGSYPDLWQMLNQILLLPPNLIEGIKKYPVLSPAETEDLATWKTALKLQTQALLLLISHEFEAGLGLLELSSRQTKVRYAEFELPGDNIFKTVEFWLKVFLAVNKYWAGRFSRLQAIQLAEFLEFSQLEPLATAATTEVTQLAASAPPTIIEPTLPDPEAKPGFSTAASVLEYLKTAKGWEGDDLEECLKAVYESRGKIEF